MERDFVELYKYNMRDYSTAVNEERAIPDARTGLKPIHTKILYEMYVDKIFSTGKFKKCAYMVGQLISRFTPHGDSATYDALVRLAQPWIQRYPLIDFHGNYGSALGDNQAAMRYTEAKLSPIAEQGFLQGLDKNAIDWKMNFSNEEKEPETLPAIFPGLFCLPNQGMGYACSCNFLTYNLQEVVQAVQQYIQSGTIPILQYDLASGGTIINPSEAKKISGSGKGTIIIDATYSIDNNKIYFTEFPFNQNFDLIYDKIIKLYEEGYLPHVRNFRNDSGNGKLQLTVECTSNNTVQETLSYLLAKTPLRTSYTINQVALVDKQPKLLNHKQMFDIYIAHNLSCIKREHQFDLDKTLERIEILEGLARALKGIDNVIALIRSSKSAADAKRYMIDKIGLTERQADAILKMQLSRLAKLEESQILQELEEKKSLAKKFKMVVESSDEQKKILVERLSQLARDFSSPRKTKVIDKPVEKTMTKMKKEKEPERCVVCLADNGFYLKRVLAAQYRESSANSWAIPTFTNKTVNIFTAFGKVYRVKIDGIKECLAADKGTVIGSLVNIDSNDIIRAISVEDDDVDMFAVTFCGRVKRFSSQLFNGRTQNKKGSSYIKLTPKDEVRLLVDLQGGKWIHFIAPRDEELIINAITVNQSGKASSGQVGFKFAASASDKHILSVEQLEDASTDTLIGKVGGRGKKCCLKKRCEV